MNIDCSEIWCEHEFVVQRTRVDGAETHTISVYGDNEVVHDVVRNEAENRIVKEIVVRGRDRDEEEYNRYGQVMITRKVEPGELGTLQIHEASHGTMRSEKLTIKTNDGRLVRIREQLFANNIRQSESETHFSPDGNPSLTVTSTYAPDSRITRYEQIVWHCKERPAITECTEFDWYGCAELYTKTLHNTNGAPLWEERVHFPENSAKPKKKEVFMFNTKAERTIVDVTEYDTKGELQHAALVPAPLNKNEQPLI